MRLEKWAQPRGLVDERTVMVGIGLDNPYVTDPEKCRFLACLTVEGEPEIGDGIGTKVIPAGLYAAFEFEGSWSALPTVFDTLYEVWLPQCGAEGVLDLELFELLTTPVNPRSLHSRIAVQVRSL